MCSTWQLRCDASLIHHKEDHSEHSERIEVMLVGPFPWKHPSDVPAASHILPLRLLMRPCRGSLHCFGFSYQFCTDLQKKMRRDLLMMMLFDVSPPCLRIRDLENVLGNTPSGPTAGSRHAMVQVLRLFPMAIDRLIADITDPHIIDQELRENGLQDPDLRTLPSNTVHVAFLPKGSLGISHMITVVHESK